MDVPLKSMLVHLSETLPRCQQKNHYLRMLIYHTVLRQELLKIVEFGELLLAEKLL